MLGLPASTPAEGVESYAVALEELRSQVGIPASFQAWGVSEADFMGKLDELALGAYEDQCAPANPRMPMREDMKELMTAAYYGTTLEDVRSRSARHVSAGAVPAAVVVGEGDNAGADEQEIAATS
jgi:acetaldehyde dehydrogenase/alcohol dehydrogenase